jgi:hypothetical protein
VDEKTAHPAPAREPARSRARRLAIAILFSAILLIPRLRRLRRRPGPWLVLRTLVAAAGGVLIWRFLRLDGGPRSLVIGAVLVILGVAVRARPEKKTVDDVARELDALVVVNGGDFSGAGNTHRDVNIAVGPERLIVLTRAFEKLAEIPLDATRQISTGPAGANGHRSSAVWELRIDWESEGPETARFRFQGTFAEHLARVASQTITSVWKKSLPVIRT